MELNKEQALALSRARRRRAESQNADAIKNIKTVDEIPNGEKVAENQSLWINNFVSDDKINEWKTKGSIGFGEAFAKGMKKENVPVLGALYSVPDAGKAMGIVRNMQKGGDVSEENKDFLSEYLMEAAEIEARGITLGGKIATGVVQMPSFMVDFASTGALAGLGKAGLVSGVKAVLKQSVGTTALSAVKGAGKMTARGAARTALMPHRIVQNAGERYIGDSIAITDKGAEILKDADIKPATTFLKAIGDVLIENISEESGEAILAPVFGKISKGLVKRMPEKLVKGFSKLVEETTNTKVSQAVNKLGFNGVVEELGEERIGALLRTTFDLDEEEGYSFEQFGNVIPSWDEFLVEAGVIGIWGGASRGSQLLANRLLSKGVKQADIDGVLKNLTETEKDALLKQGDNPEAERAYKEQKQVLINQMVDTGIVDVDGAEQVATLIDARVAASAEVLKMTKAERLQELAIEIQSGIADEFILTSQGMDIVQELINKGFYNYDELDGEVSGIRLVTSLDSDKFYEQVWKNIPENKISYDRYSGFTTTINNLPEPYKSEAISNIPQGYDYKNIDIDDNGRLYIKDDKRVNVLLSNNEFMARDKDGNIIAADDVPFQSSIPDTKRGAIQLGERNIITLFENADKSTILHELGHLFLRDMERISTIADNEQLKQEMDTIRTWLKNDGGVFTIEQQEQFAMGFEQYLRTGKAPTSKLAEAFDKFNEWLRSIYTSAKMLKADITPEVARVFDSMLMTQAEKVETGFYDAPTEFETLFQNARLAFTDNLEAQRILDNIEFILDLEGDLKDSDLKDIRKEVRKLREIEPTQAKVQIKKDIQAVEEVIKSKEDIVTEQVRRLEKKLAKQKRDLEMQEPVPEEQYETVLNMTDTADDLLKAKGLNVKSGDRLGRKLFVPISTRLGEIDKRLKHTMRKFEFNVNIRKNEDMEKVKGFFDKVQNLSEEDYKILDFAMKNIDLKKIDEIATKYDMQDDIKNIRRLLDDIRSRAIKVGIDVNLVENYFPRSVENADAYLTWLKGSENWTYIDRQLKEAKMENSTNDEKAEFINLMLARYDIKEFKERLFKSTKPTMQRKFTRITPEMNAFYKDSNQALLNYIGSMNNLIEAKKFWGLDKFNDESIGGIIRDMITDKNLTVSEETELKDVLRARFGQLGARGIIRAYKNMTYIYAMGSVSSAITQIGDLGLSLYKNGFYNTKQGLSKALSHEKITKQDLGIEAIAQEFMDETKSATAVRKVFKLVGLEFMDNLGKETTINASLSRLQQEARKPTKRFENYMNDIFGNEAEQVIKDLKDGNITENVKYILFSELSDLQPISLAEMPEGYLTGGNSRIFYMLKTYTIKLFDVYRNDVYMKIASGDDDEVKEGIKNLIRLSIALTLTGATADTIKDILFNRELDFSDLMLDNILKLFGFSKWQIYKSRKEGLGTTLLQTILPPVPLFDDLYKDIAAVVMNKKGRKIKDFRTWKGIPLVGKLYYWWFGGGSEQKR